MALTYEKGITGLVVIDPYNDFISEGGKVWDRLKGVAEANQCIPHMLQVLDAARRVDIRVFYALHRQYRPGDYESWKYVAPIQKAAWSRKTFEYGTWGGEIRREFKPRAGDVVAAEHWCSSPRWTSENRPWADTSKPANGAEPEQDYLYLARGRLGKHFCET